MNASSGTVVQLLARPDVIIKRHEQCRAGSERTPAAFVATCATMNLKMKEESVGEERTLTGVIETEVGATVDDDTLHEAREPW